MKSMIPALCAAAAGNARALIPLSLWKEAAGTPGLICIRSKHWKTSLTWIRKSAEAHLQLGNLYSTEHALAAIPSTERVNSIRTWLTSVTGWDTPMSALARKTALRKRLRSIRKFGSSIWPSWTNNGRKSGSLYIQRRMARRPSRSYLAACHTEN